MKYKMTISTDECGAALIVSKGPCSYELYAMFERGKCRCYVEDDGNHVADFFSEITCEGVWDSVELILNVLLHHYPPHFITANDIEAISGKIASYQREIA